MKKAFRVVISIILVITMLTTPMFMHHSFAVTDETVYSIDVIWEDISFIYNQGDFEWNPGSHSYDVEDSTSGWDDKNGKITAINHSSLAVEILVSFELAEPANGTVALSIENELFILMNSKGKSNDVEANRMDVVDKINDMEYRLRMLKDYIYNCSLIDDDLEQYN